LLPRYTYSRVTVDVPEPGGDPDPTVNAHHSPPFVS
jgi:hypothetical protein